MYLALANAVTVIHAVLIISVFVGIGLGITIKRFRPVEAFILLFTVIVWSLYGGCPLTYLENYLRLRASHPIPLVQTGFISYYSNRWFGLNFSDRNISIATYTVVAFFLILTMDWEFPYFKKRFLKKPKTRRSNLKPKSKHLKPYR